MPASTLGFPRGNPSQHCWGLPFEDIPAYRVIFPEDMVCAHWAAPHPLAACPLISTSPGRLVPACFLVSKHRFPWEAIHSVFSMETFRTSRCPCVTSATGFLHPSACTGTRKELHADFQAKHRALSSQHAPWPASHMHASGSSGPWEQWERGQVLLCPHCILQG